MRKKVDQLGDGVLDNHAKVVTLDQVRPLAPSRIPSSVWACRGRGRDGDPPEGTPVAVQGLSPCIHRSSPARARESKQFCITPYTVSLGRSERVYLPRATPRVPACTLLLIRSQNEYVMEKPDLLRLTQITVNGLFGIYHHRIALNLDDRSTLLHGPNGVGKTVILRMINAILQNRLEYFRSIPFSHFRLDFQDDSSLALEVVHTGDQKIYTISVTKEGETNSSSIDWSTRPVSIAERVEYLHPHPHIPNMWVDMRDDALLSSNEVIDRYRPALSQRRRQSRSVQIPWYDHFLKNANSHLIEAQRLLQINPNPRLRRRYGRVNRGSSMISTVIECSKDFQARLRNTMALYGRRSQTLDQSFPQRLISAREELTREELHHRMDTLQKQTKGFKSIGILDETPTYPFNMFSLDSLDKTQARVMTLYVSDTETKLQVLDNLASRTRVFLENVNQKYRYKRIRLHRKHGFVAENDNGTMLPLESLSSGEQQELVLNYDLLFRVPSNTIVLIDEPELSLHVAWQKRFLPDLLTIIELATFDALVATHSPFIVGDRDDLMVGIGDQN